MAATVTHTFNCPLADDPKAAANNEILVSHWNANHTVTGVRDSLTAARNYYVSATGSDSNGGTNATTDAWLTLQHAVDFIANNLDFNGFDVVVNIGAGTFTGFGIKPTVGGGRWQFRGAGPASTTVLTGPNDGFYNQTECISVYVVCESLIGINNMLLSQTMSEPNILIANLCNMRIGDVINGGGNMAFQYTAGVGSGMIECAAGKLGIQHGPMSVQGTTDVDFLQVTQTNGVILDNGIWTINSNMNLTYGFIVGGIFSCGGQWNTFGNGSYTIGGGGSVTGRRFYGLFGSTISATSRTLFPGTLPGLCDPSSNYGGSQVPLTVSDLLSNFAASSYGGSRMVCTDLTTAVTYGTTLVGGGSTILPVYSDGTNWRQG